MSLVEEEKVLDLSFSDLTKTILTEKPFYRVLIDFMHRRLPESKEGYKYALIMMCAFTRWPVVAFLKTKNEDEIGEAIFNNLISVYGIPKYIHSDNESSLVREGLTRCFNRLNSIRTTSLVLHPQSNPVERLMKTFNEALTITTHL